MSKKIGTYEELLVEKQKLEVLFQAQKELVKFEINDIKAELEPAFNALEFLKKLALRNADNPILQSGVNILIDMLSNKLQGENPGFIRTIIIPYVLKNYASNLVANQADHLIDHLISLFKDDESTSEN